MTSDLDKIDALLTLVKKHNYRVGLVVVSAEHIQLEGLLPLAPDVEEEAIVEARANRSRDKERLEEDLKFAGIR